MSAKAAAVAVNCGELPLGGGLLALLRPALNEMEPGGVLAVLSRATTVREDLPSWCRAERHEYLGLETIGRHRSSPDHARRILGCKSHQQRITAEATRRKADCVRCS